jgi:3-hydroxyisobutyrate dehydrogenase-like beta-hydroxyacid dehydrogenase
VLWASDGRSAATASRARSADPAEVHNLRELAERSDAILSICPPDAAVDVAEQVARVRTSGLLYIDANTVAPETVRRIADIFEPGAVVDAAVTGSPRLDLGATVPWLSGPRAAEAARLFAGPLTSTRIVGVEVGQASAFKICAGLRSKVIPAVWATLIDTAKAYGPEVEESVREHLADIGHDMSEQEAKIAERAPKAWRWTGEMAESAKAMTEVGMPTGFSTAALETYRRLSEAMRER